MKRPLFGALGLLIAGTAVLVPACAENDSSLAIIGVLVPTTDTCLVVADITSPQYKEGTFDVAIGYQYAASVLVENQMVPRGDPNKLRTETNSVQLYSADVQVQDASGATLARADGSSAEFTVPISGFVGVGLGGVPGVGFTNVLMIDSATAKDLAGSLKGQALNLIASVVIHGRDLGGNEVKTGAWAFPITACDGCLVECPPKASDPLLAKGPNCLSTAEDPKPNCRLGLDTAVDCRLCRGNPACLCCKTVGQACNAGECCNGNACAPDPKTKQFVCQ